MRTCVTGWALALACLQVASALNGAITRKLVEMADMGLYPDGTPMEGVDSDTMMTTFTTDPPFPPPPPTDDIEPEYIELPLDNFAKSKNQDYSYYGTFYNRYWVNDASYKPGGPVFIYDAGEADASTNAQNRLRNSSSFFKRLVDKYQGIGIVWEHRYYGNSTPEPINVNTPPEAFKWLNTEQSLADVDRFAWQFKRKDISYDLTPKTTPWIFVGGSYPGMRAAFMRDKYPDTIYAGYASSAPTQAQIDMSVYFEPVWDGMQAYGYGNCSRDINAAVRYIDNMLEKPVTAAKIKEQFLGLGAADNSHATFADALGTIFYTWQAYGPDGGKQGIGAFCDWIERDPKTNRTAGREGWATSKGAAWTVARWAAWDQFVPMVNDFMTTDCSGSQTVKGNCNLDLKFGDPAMISWTWQYCTQWGYFQSANLGPHQLLSKHNSLNHQKDICHRQFPDANFRDHGFPDWPDVRRTNRIFGGWSLRPSNVYWSGGQFDPWRTLSPLSGEGNAPPVRPFSSRPPRCGEGQDQSSIFGYVIERAQHCYDFRTTKGTPKGAEVSRANFERALDGWLGCWKPRRDSRGPGGRGRQWWRD
ncbi:peptidase S28 [Westerdykella ornata]|uniref:Peptidase S28 n=1 Tax=Westerdykella ornata TaxID=318751 RepID=A0A6A6J9Q0_WESOR|nr:peptidase S28 [Westerdykella ornata]KAF2273112.1 peptidase S28 [Westerdykella ornata]